MSLQQAPDNCPDCRKCAPQHRLPASLAKAAGVCGSPGRRRAGRRTCIAPGRAADRVEPMSSHDTMRILVTNDDGIDAPGLHALREIAGHLSDDVWVVAPESNQSGASHSLSLHEPLRMRRVDERAFA